jgi:hypothetical protein
MDRQNLYAYIGVVIVLLTACFALVARPTRVRLVRGAAVGGILLALVWSWSTYEMPYDFKRFWHVGRDISAGVNYYALNPRGDRQLILNPPTVVPLFRAWALLPLRKSARFWVGLNALGVMALVPLAHAAVRARMEPQTLRLPRSTLAILAAALALSCSHTMGLALGQVSVLMAAAVILALHAQAAGRPWLAGIGLAIATVKVNTLLPFLMLFTRKEDRATWVSFTLCCAGLCLASGNPAELPRHIATTLETIRVTYEPGQVNDYAFAGPSHASLVGIDHALWRVGLRDRRAIGIIQLGILLLLATGLIRQIRSRRLPLGADCALVALYASVFLYHRTYDMVLLIVPLVYAALRAQRSSSPTTRRTMACLAVAILLVLFVNPDGLKTLERWSFGIGPFARLIQASLLPMATWLILASLFGLWRLSVRELVPDGGPTPVRAGPIMHDARRHPHPELQCR